MHAVGSDLNPVAAIICKASVQLPPVFSKFPSVNPRSQSKIDRDKEYGVANDIEYYGGLVHRLAYERLKSNYPSINALTDSSNDSSEVIGYIWARTIPSPDPAYHGVNVPIVTTFVLCKKPGKEAFISLTVNKNLKSYSFEISMGAGEDFERAKKGTKGGNSTNFVCVFSGAPITQDYIKDQACKNKIGVEMMAIVVNNRSGRKYVQPTKLQMEVEQSIVEFDKINGAMNENCSDLVSGRGYGYRYWHQLFTNRQNLSLSTIQKIIQELKLQIKKDTEAHNKTMVEEGQEPRDADIYSNVILLYLSMCFSKLLNHCNAFVGWNITNQNAGNLFSRQALPMAWDFFELNPIGNLINFSTVSRNIANTVRNLPVSSKGTVFQANAIHGVHSTKFDVIHTDPPYYDNISYAELSDYYYVWHRKLLHNAFPELFGGLLTPKSEEIVAFSYRHGSKKEAEGFFLAEMRKFFTNMSRNSSHEFPSVVYYAFKQSEIERDGLSSPGWTTFLQAMVDSGIQVTATWPIMTERQARSISQGRNALSSSIALVCRSRESHYGEITKSEFVRTLSFELPPRIKNLQATSIAPTDLLQSAIGMGIGIFSRYEGILEANDHLMTVSSGIKIINDELDKTLRGADSEIDPETRFAVYWYEQFGYETRDFGIANGMAQAGGISVENIERAGIITASKGKVRILRRSELNADSNPVNDLGDSIWRCCQFLVRTLEENGEQAVATLINRFGRDYAENAKLLAYRLYKIASEKMKDSSEASAFNALVVVWPELVQFADQQKEEASNSQFDMNL